MTRRAADPGSSSGRQGRQVLAWVERCLRWGLAALFVASGLLKFQDPARFASVIAGFGLLPEAMIWPAAIGLPVLETVAGVGLFFSLRGSLALLSSLLVLFIVVLVYGIRLGLDIDCGCFGPEDPEQEYKGLKAALARDAVMMAAALFLWWYRGWARQGGERFEQ
jgi:hypothetical protein